MAEILTFSHCLNKLLQKHELSSNQLSAAVGCTRSEIKQILATEGTEIKRNQLFEKIKNCNLFLPEEIWELEQSLQVSRTGLERYRFQNAIEQILSGNFAYSSTEMMSGSGKSISSILEIYQEAEQVDILCLNSCFPGIIQALRPLFNQKDRKIRMWHLISTAAAAHRSASLVACILPLLFDSRYLPYSITLSSDADLSPVGGNLFAIRGYINGVKKETFLAAIDANLFYELPNADLCGMFAYTSNLFKAIRGSLTLLKETEHSKEDFTSLCMTFLSHELNHATYTLANGLLFQQIPTSIVIAALNGADFFSEEETAELIKRTVSIHEQRFQNIYHKRKPSYMIMTQAGCRQFLDSGINQDHFVGCRPFTPAERKEIFRCMLETAESNPYYSPLLMKDPHFQHRYNLECSEKLGVSFDLKDTNYDLHDGYRPVFLMFPEFTKEYLSYYLETLVNEKCYSRETSLRLLREIYDAFLKKFNLQA